jgi:tetratricopeptide (TPR) repeat protein
MANRFSNLLMVLFLTALCAVPAMAQFGAIEGDVKNADGTPGIGALVTIDRTDMKGHYQVVIKDKKTGHYYYGGLPLGTYKVAVKINDKEVDAVNGVRVGLGDPIKVNFDMKEAQLRSQAAAAGVVVPQAQAGPGTAPKISKEEQEKIEAVTKKNEEIKKKNAALSSGFNAGLAAMQAKDYPEAIKQFSTASEADATQSAVWANLGEAYNQLSKSKSGDERKDAVAKGIDAYQKAVALKPDDGSLHHNLGLLEVNAGQVDQGVAELQKAAQLDPANAGQFYFNLGAVLTNAGKTDEAVAAFQNAVKADPNKADAYYQIGTALMGKATLDAKSGKITPAPGTIEAYQKYLDLKPDGPYADTCKQMITTLGGTIATEVKTPSDNKKKKNP